jgi:hypothetical protein
MAARWQAAGNETRLAVYPGGGDHAEVARFLLARLENLTR